MVVNKNIVYIRETRTDPPTYWVKYGIPTGMNQLYPPYRESCDTLKEARKRQRELRRLFMGD